MTDNTLDWYRDNAEAFAKSTMDADMRAFYVPFLALVPPGGYILDLGCGAGSASEYFVSRGYRVLAADGCEAMCEITRRRAGCPVRLMRFDQMDFEGEFDGVWACASLLHVPEAGLAGVLRLVRRALKTGGAFYASFKYGEGERTRGGRTFTDLTEETLRALLLRAGGFEVRSVRITRDVRPGRENERWVNALCLAE